MLILYKLQTDTLIMDVHKISKLDDETLPLSSIVPKLSSSLVDIRIVFVALSAGAFMPDLDA